MLAYLSALEAGGKYTLMVWPVHCVLGTWGHAMPAILTDALGDWEEATQTPVLKVLKGLNPMTEQYNDALVKTMEPTDGLLFVAGEALSHCVRATVLDLLDGFSPEQVARTVLLTDCMSAVAGFEQNAAEFLNFARSLGVKTMASVDAI